MKVEDSEIVIKWRNKLRISNVSKIVRREKISLKEHITWFNKNRDNRIDYIIESKHTKKAIGSLGVLLYKNQSSVFSAEMNKYIGEETQLGQGLATEATKKWVEYLFNYIGIDSIFIKTRFDNLANIRVNEKLGFEKLEDCSFFNISDRQWICMVLSNKKNHDYKY